MSYRVAVVAIALTVFTGSPAFAQTDPSQTNVVRDSLAKDRVDLDTGKITGSVRARQDAGLENARVELREVATGRIVSSVYTNPAGLFQFHRVPDGGYEIVATAGLNEARERVTVSRNEAMVTLRILNADVDPTAGDAQTVSVAQMRIPEKARKALRKAQEAGDKQKVADAYKHVDEALKICPEFADALAYRAVLLLNENKPEEALPLLDEAVKHDPSLGVAYVELGAAYNMLKRFDDAIRALDRAMALTPTSWQAYFESARANLGKGEFATALRQITRAQDLVKKEFPPIYLVKAHALLGTKDYTEAVANFEAFLKSEPDGPNSTRARETLAEVKAFTEQARK